MVINDYKKFIFVHIPKAAGTSVMRSLAKINGNNKRWLASSKHETLSEFAINVHRRYSIVDRLMSKSPEQYFTFAFVRNPWDRMSSFYRYLYEQHPQKLDSVVDFRDFLIKSTDKKSWINNFHSMRPQTNFIDNSNKRLKLNYLGHFEYINDDFEAIAKKIEVKARLKRENVSINSKKDYRQDYDDHLISIVAERFAKEIKIFGYEFSTPYPKNRYSRGIDLAL
jgi:hypothetical protein